MRCGIITVYDSLNCGSYLQAYALRKAVADLGKESCVIQRASWDVARSYIKKVKKYIYCALKRDRINNKVYKNFECGYPMLSLAPCRAKVPVYIMGSDTIWDVSTPFFGSRWKFFWGAQFKNAKLISYAPSVGFSKQADIERCSFIRAALQNMSAVSVRDQNSKDLLQPYCDKEISIVCDPTYLLDRSEYDAIAKPTKLEKFLFIYYYGKMPADYQKAIQDYCKANALKTVTFGPANPWCDISLAYDPLLFLSIYQKADYIVTNTFHGTVFATIYEKRFAVTKNDKPKVLDVLKMCALSDKMTDTAEDISTILNSAFNYDVTRQNILREREKGLEYLKKAIEG